VAPTLGLLAALLAVGGAQAMRNVAPVNDGVADDLGDADGRPDADSERGDVEQRSDVVRVSVASL
jgi:hypothetical protein